jgi:Iron-containing alcohol dehydrogenase
VSILISDFDGTVTRYDFFERVRKRWPFSPQDDPWEKFVAGKITHFQALAEGQALDVAKYSSFLCRLPYFSVPTSLSNDGFCSSQSSLTFDDRRRPLPSAMPSGVILDTAVCLNAPSAVPRARPAEASISFPMRWIA